MNDQRRFLLAGLCLAFVALLALLLITVIGSRGVAAACSMPSPPGSGDWIISANDVCTPTAGPWTVNGNIEVKANGNLTLNGVRVQMASASAGQRSIYVRTGGTLNVYSGSTITATNPAFHYMFLVEKGATVQMSSSTIEYCGYDISPSDAIGMRVQSDQVTITKTTFRNSYAGIFVDGASPTVDNSTFQTNRFGIFISGNSAKPKFYDNRVLTNVDGVFVTDSAPIFGKNDIHDNTDRGVFLLRANATVSGNNIYNNMYAIYIQAASPVIVGNNIHDHLDGVKAYFSYPQIKNNDFHQNTNYTIYMFRSGGTIEGNTLNGPKFTFNSDTRLLNGISLITSTTTVKGNRIVHYNHTAINVDSNSNVKILNNDIEFFESDGLIISSSKIDIEGNIIQNSLEDYSQQLSISDSSGTIKSNQFSLGKYGLYAWIEDRSLVVDGNTFKGFIAPTKYRSSAAITLYEAHIIIKGNTFDSNSRAINVSSSRPVITGNTFTNNFNGIDVNFYTDAYIANNTFTLGNYSMNIWGGRATLVNNTISLSMNYSVFVKFGAIVSMIGNKIDGNNNEAVYIQDSFVSLTKNTISSSGTGLWVWDAQVTLENNTFSKDNDGAYFKNSTVTAIGDTYANNTVDGLTIIDSTATLNDQKFYDNEAGFYSFDCRLIINYATFINNKVGMQLWEEVTSSARGVYVKGSRDITVQIRGSKALRDNKNYIDGSNITDNKGSFQVQMATLVLTSSVFDGGQAGIEVTNGTLNMKDCTLGSINATAITTVDGTVTVEGSYLFNNTMGIYSQTSTLSVISSRIEDSNQTGIQSDRSQLVVRDSRIVNNKDGIFELGGSSFNVLNCNISSNKVFGIYTTDKSKAVLINYTRKIINQDNIFMVHGQLVVSDGGQLFLLRSNLEFWSEAPSDSGATIMAGGQLTMRENVVFAFIHDNGYYFIAEPGSYLSISNATFRHCGLGSTGLVKGLEVRTDRAYLSDIYFENNQIGLHVINAKLQRQAYDLRFNANEIGMVVENGEVYLVSSWFNASTDKDIILMDSTANLLDTKITFTKVQLDDPSSVLVVMWYLKVTVVWNDGQPVNGASVNITDKSNSQQVGHTDPQGDSPRFIVREYIQKGSDPSGYTLLTPTDIKGTVNHLTVDKSVNVDSSMTVRIIMNDDKPPEIKVTTPAPGEIVYSGNLLFAGTAYDEGSSVASVEVSLDGKNWFTANGTTSWTCFMAMTNGMQDVKIRGTDTRGNSMILTMTVQVDLASPLLQVYHPLDGTITNLTIMNVTGRVHQGAQLFINIVSITTGMDVNGTFYYLFNMTEGQNKLHFRAISKDGRQTMDRDITVTKDTIPPKIILQHPKPGAILNTYSITVTVSSNEDVLFYINGQAISTFAGKADGIVQLHEGTNNITVKAKDRAGNWNTYKFDVIRDTIKPDLKLIKPASAVLSTTKDKLDIVGTTEVGANLTIQNRSLALDPGGSFKITKNLKVGKNTILVVSTDKAGNANVIELEVTRKQVIDYTPYYVLLVVFVVFGLVADIATLLYFRKFYVPKAPQKGTDEGPGKNEPGQNEQNEGQAQSQEGERRYPKRPPPQQVTEDTEFEEVEDLGEI